MQFRMVLAFRHVAAILISHVAAILLSPVLLSGEGNVWKQA